MFFWLLASLVGFGFVAAVCWAMHFLERRPWLRFVLRNPKVLWYWGSSWLERRRRRSSSSTPARQEEIVPGLGLTAMMMSRAREEASRIEIRRVEYFANDGSMCPVAIYNLKPPELYTLAFPRSSSYAAVEYRYNGLAYVSLVCPTATGQDTHATICREVESIGPEAENFLYDISSGNPQLNEVIERVFGPRGCFRGLPSHLFDYLGRKSSIEPSADVNPGVVIVRGLARSFLLDLRTRAIQPFQGSMDDERVIEPPFVFYGMTDTVSARELLDGNGQRGEGGEGDERDEYTPTAPAHVDWSEILGSLNEMVEDTDTDESGARATVAASS